VARVAIPRALRDLAGGHEQIEVEAGDVRQLLAELERRYPGLGHALREDSAVAIDAEIVPDPLLERVGPDSEVHFLPRVAGGA
jgi:molybdopterin converting factor small subunit